MAETEPVSRLPQPLPESITISGTPNVRLSANDMRALRKATGKTMEELMGENAADEDRLQAVAWLELRRQGYEPTWEQAGELALQFETEVPDPTSGEPSTSSPPSAASGA